MIKNRSSSQSHYEIPKALRHDAYTLANDARTLIQATLHSADSQVAAARKRLESAVETGKELAGRAQSSTVERVRRTDRCVRDHPYETIALAFGLGALVTCLCFWRD